MGKGSFINAADPSLHELRRRDAINVRCKCGHEKQFAPFQLIGFKGITERTAVWSLRDRFKCTKCRRRPPASFWIAKWQD